MKPKQPGIQLSDHFSYGRLLRFVFPSIVMMVFTSLYSVVDGLFVSNFVGKTPFAALNLIMPLLMILSAAGFMIGTGGSALVAKVLGEGDDKRANELFSLLILTALFAGIVLSAIGMLAVRPVAIALGAEGEMIDYCVLYGRITMISLPAFLLQNTFQSFLVVAQKPGLGLAVMVGAGVTNMTMDALLVGVLGCGLAGAAGATVMSEFVGGLLPLFYFLRKNDSLLYLTRPILDFRALRRACANGLSELMSNLSMPIVNILYNLQLIRLIGADGVAAYGVIMYLNFVFVSIFLGYSIGSAPIISYHYGAQNRAELRSLFRKSVTIVGVFGICMVVLAELLSHPLSLLFVGYDAALCELTRHGLRLFSLAFLISGTNIFGSSLFTALNNGLISAVISFSRTLLFQCAAVMLLPLVLGVDGIWLSIVAAEVCTAAVTLSFFLTQRKRYFSK